MVTVIQSEAKGNSKTVGVFKGTKEEKDAAGAVDPRFSSVTSKRGETPTASTIKQSVVFDEAKRQVSKGAGIGTFLERRLTPSQLQELRSLQAQTARERQKAGSREVSQNVQQAPSQAQNIQQAQANKQNVQQAQVSSRRLTPAAAVEAFSQKVGGTIESVSREKIQRDGKQFLKGFEKSEGQVASENLKDLKNELTSTKLNRATLENNKRVIEKTLEEDADKLSKGVQDQLKRQIDEINADIRDSKSSERELQRQVREGKKFDEVQGDTTSFKNTPAQLERLGKDIGRGAITGIVGAPEATRDLARTILSSPTGVLVAGSQVFSPFVSPSLTVRAEAVGALLGGKLLSDVGGKVSGKTTTLETIKTAGEAKLFKVEKLSRNPKTGRLVKSTDVVAEVPVEIVKGAGKGGVSGLELAGDQVQGSIGTGSSQVKVTKGATSDFPRAGFEPTVVKELKSGNKVLEAAAEVKPQIDLTVKGGLLDPTRSVKATEKTLTFETGGFKEPNILTKKDSFFQINRASLVGVTEQVARGGRLDRARFIVEEPLNKPPKVAVKTNTELVRGEASGTLRYTFSSAEDVTASTVADFIRVTEQRGFVTQKPLNIQAPKSLKPKTGGLPQNPTIKFQYENAFGRTQLIKLPSGNYKILNTKFAEVEKLPRGGVRPKVEKPFSKPVNLREDAKVELGSGQEATLKIPASKSSEITKEKNIFEVLELGVIGQVDFGFLSNKKSPLPYVAPPEQQRSGQLPQAEKLSRNSFEVVKVPKVDVVPKIDVGDVVKPSTNFDIGVRGKLESGSRSSQSLKVQPEILGKSDVQPLKALKPKNVVGTIPDVAQDLGRVPVSKTRQLQLPKLDVRQVTSQKLKVVPATGEPRISRPARRIVPFKKATIGRVPKASGFDVYVKFKGKFKKVNPVPLSRGQALSLGGGIVERTQAATLKLVKSKERPVKLTGLPDFNKKAFRSPKKAEKDVFIEKDIFRINTGGELKSITFKGLQALKIKRGKKRFTL